MKDVLYIGDGRHHPMLTETVSGHLGVCLMNARERLTV